MTLFDSPTLRRVFPGWGAMADGSAEPPSHNVPDCACLEDGESADDLRVIAQPRPQIKENERTIKRVTVRWLAVWFVVVLACVVATGAAH